MLGLIRPEIGVLLLILLCAARLSETLPAAHEQIVWPLPFRLSVAATWEQPEVEARVAAGMVLAVAGLRALARWVGTRRTTGAGWPRTHARRRIACDAGDPGRRGDWWPLALKDCRGRKAVLQVFYSLPGSVERLSWAAGPQYRSTGHPAAGSEGKRCGGAPGGLPFPIASEGARDAATACLLFRRSLGDPGKTVLGEAPTLIDLLIDRYDYARARWSPADVVVTDAVGSGSLAHLMGQVDRLVREPRLLLPGRSRALVLGRRWEGEHPPLWRRNCPESEQFCGKTLGFSALWVMLYWISVVLEGDCR